MTIANPFPRASRARKIIGFGLIGVYGAVCAVGVVMNAADVVRALR